MEIIMSENEAPNSGISSLGPSTGELTGDIVGGLVSSPESPGQKIGLIGSTASSANTLVGGQLASASTLKGLGKSALEALESAIGVLGEIRRNERLGVHSGINHQEEASMSWLPSNDPVLGDIRSCDALELVIVPRTRDLGDGFEVRRALPHGKRQMVGPFIFFDQMGPVQLIAGQGLDVRPHPHIGLATVTYLFDGRVMHRDSEGNALEITPGAMNLMTAGRGIAHSERSPASARQGTEGMFGIQSWIALPQAHE